MRHFNIPIFVPHYGCPFDCVFCNQRHITGERDRVTGESVRTTIRRHLETLPRTDRYVEAAFFGGSFTAVDKSLQNELLSAAYEFKKHGEIDGIRLSTRPDFIDDDIMQNLVAHGVTTVELGVQSMDDAVLAKSGRGHSAADVVNAVGVIKKYPVALGLQMMTDLPGDTDSGAVATAEKIIALAPDFVRIYPTLVIRDTRLCEMYERGEYAPQGLDAAARLCAEIWEKFARTGIDVIRVGLAATEEISPGGALMAGPYHAAFGELCMGEVFRRKMSGLLAGDSAAVFAVNPKDISKVIGNGGRNIAAFAEKNIKIEIKQDCAIKRGELVRLDK